MQRADILQKFLICHAGHAAQLIVLLGKLGFYLYLALLVLSQRILRHLYINQQTAVLAHQCGHLVLHGLCNGKLLPCRYLVADRVRAAYNFPGLFVDLNVQARNYFVQRINRCAVFRHNGRRRRHVVQLIQLINERHGNIGCRARAAYGIVVGGVDVLHGLIRVVRGIPQVKRLLMAFAVC